MSPPRHFWRSLVLTQTFFRPKKSSLGLERPHQLSKWSTKDSLGLKLFFFSAKMSLMKFLGLAGAQKCSSEFTQTFFQSKMSPFKFLVPKRAHSYFFQNKKRGSLGSKSITQRAHWVSKFFECKDEPNEVFGAQ